MSFGSEADVWVVDGHTSRDVVFSVCSVKVYIVVCVAFEREFRNHSLCAYSRRPALGVVAFEGDVSGDVSKPLVIEQSAQGNVVGKQVSAVFPVGIPVN